MKKVLVALLFWVPFQAHAYIVTSSVGTYDVTTTYTTGTNTILDDQVWYGSSSLAVEFASLVGGALGLPNGWYGPLFAYQYNSPNSSSTRVAVSFLGFSTTTGYVDETQTYGYAIARRVTAVPEPGTLTLLGAGLVGLGLLRRRRQAD